MFAHAHPDRRWWWSSVVLIAFAGLALRIAAARGAFWTDEAWSMIYAAQARDAAGVFLRINHDNNHHLVSLWLQMVGLDASPLLARLPAILAGTLCVPVAALVVLRRRSPLAGILAAILFAVSPAMVNFGSEARGYSLMMLAALATVGLVTEAVDGRELRGTPWLLAILATLGMFSHMTMVAPVGLIACWVYLDRRRVLGQSGALSETLRLMGQALAACVVVVLFVFAAAAASPTGMRLGGYEPFDLGEFAWALNALSGWTAGLAIDPSPIAPLMIAIVALAIAYRPPVWLGNRARLYALLIMGIPIAMLLLRAGNSGSARYYLLSSLALLLLASEWMAHAFQRRGGSRIAASALFAVVLVTCVWRDSQLIDLERGRPDEPAALIAQQSHGVAHVAVDPKRMEAPLLIAARQRGLAIAVTRGCAPADFLLVAQKPLQPSIMHCGVRMRPVGSATSSSLTGEAWVLYGLEGLQTPGAPVSGPPPGARSRVFSGRAGVAQG